eukprot:TRINITY_DN3698_c0_g1_i2.p1 TRINITY_DN3698_c0_g1~~TRINITY_DN3698_c0_g1_i2.p1  ORF type:complete len:219 (-),score=40.31 TRINITY_DN3698_c0_g1_i2:215-871(-)
MSISSRFLQADKLRLDLEHKLVKLQTSKDAEESQSLESACYQTINSLQSEVRELESLADKEAPARRDMWKTRVRQLSDTILQFRADLDKYIKRIQKQREFEENRRILLGGGADNYSNQKQRSKVIDLYSREQTSLQHSHEHVDTMTTIGSQVIQSIHIQRERLKSAHSKLLDVSNYIGLSNSLIKLITRREVVDKWIFYCGMLVTLVIIAVVYYYFRY